MLSYSPFDHDQLTTQYIYIGCMTGTSADAQADFTLTCFDPSGLPTHISNHAMTIPTTLQAQLRHASLTPYVKLSSKLITSIENDLTDFLSNAYNSIIDTLLPSSFPRERIILSPHGQTIEHNPDKYITIQLLNAQRLQEATHCQVAHSHRVPCMQVSSGAPLAPILIEQLFQSTQEHTVLINGGGIANICILPCNQSSPMIAFDTGPANGPIDELINTLLHHDDLNTLPPELRKTLRKTKIDYDGQVAQLGTIHDDLYQRLNAHPYFSKPIQHKSADRSWFSHEWINLAIQGTDCNIIDAITTVSAVVADSIAHAITTHINPLTPTIPMRVICYGGMIHNSYIMQRLQKILAMNHDVTFIDMKTLAYDPDFFESLLMAYLGYCVHTQREIDLGYLSQAKQTRVTPGLLLAPPITTTT